MNTLPLPNEVLSKWYYAYRNCTRLIEPIYREKRIHIDIFQKHEIIKFFLNKLYWFSLLYHQMFYPMTSINQKLVKK